MQMQKIMRFHGGVQDKNVLDFSVNVNPLGVPKCIKDYISECIDECVYERYPDYEYKNLRKAIANFFEVSETNIVPTNGAAEALSLTILALRPRTLIVLEPSYGDYELMSRAIGAKCIHITMTELHNEYVLPNDSMKEIIRHAKDNSLIIINSPNNPTGSIVELDKILELSKCLKHSYIVLDEVYAELSEYTSIIKVPPSSLPENLIIVKSFTKIFAIPGIRLGFIYVTSEHLRELFESVRPAWNVSSIAECALANALSKCKSKLWSYIEKSRNYIAMERRRLTSMLQDLGIIVYNSKTNFLLLRHDFIESFKLYEYLLRKFRIAIRPAHTFYGLTKYHSRISIKSKNENMYLVEAFRHAIKNFGRC